MLRSFIAVTAALLLLSACGTPESAPREGPGFVNGKPVHPLVKMGSAYTIKGETYVPRYQPNYSEEGEASWYGPGFHAKQTANGERFDQYAMTAAHKTLPLPSMVRVTNTANGRSIIVRVNDRGPFSGDRIIDLSKKAAQEIDMIRTGVAHVKVEYLPRETEAYIAQLGGQKSESRLAWERENTPSDATQLASNDAAPNRDVNASKDSDSWFPSFISSANAEDTKPNQTHKAAETSTIASNELAPLQPANPALPARLPHPASADYTPSVKPTREAPKTQPDAQGSYTNSSFSVLEGQASPLPKTIKPINSPPPPKQQVMSVKPSEPTKPPEQIPKLAIQVGAFNSRANAEKISEKLGSLAPAMIKGVPEEAPTLYRVRLGPFSDRYSAESVLSKVRDNGAPDAQLVSY